ncbi:MAG: DUF296 domain-containing protein [Rhodobacteraceae bacterium]|nr:DUF296 domain-containing protein [Paracoccaceae bacterium]
MTSTGRFLALRLTPGDDLVAGLRRAFLQARVDAGAVVACTGSLSRVRLRFAGRDAAEDLEGPFEILSLSGTLDPSHQHLHLSLGDSEGRVTGGHLVAGGAEVRTTVEAVLLLLPDYRFDRAPCTSSGFAELVVGPSAQAERP